MSEFFRRFAARISAIAGSPWAFIVALLIITTWALSGPAFGFSDTWQLFINTGTTIATLLMVFLIQNTQNRDSRAIHLKLDELIKGIKGARDKLVDIEDLPDEVLEEIHKEFRALQEKHHSKAKSGSKKAKKATNFLKQLADIVEQPIGER